MVATAFKLVRVSCVQLENQFAKLQTSVAYVWRRFRTDAKCEDGRVVLAGFEMGTRRWFALELTQREASHLFN